MGNFITKLKNAIIDLLSGPIEFGFQNKQKHDNTAVAKRRGNIIYLREPKYNEHEEANTHHVPIAVESGGNIIDLFKHLESKEHPKTTEAIVFKPQHMMDTIEIIEQMKSGRMCFVDLESLNSELATKITNRLNNTCIELNGTISKITDRAICYTHCDTIILPSSNEYKMK